MVRVCFRGVDTRIRFIHFNWLIWWITIWLKQSEKICWPWILVVIYHVTLWLPGGRHSRNIAFRPNFMNKCVLVLRPQIAQRITSRLESAVTHGKSQIKNENSNRREFSTLLVLGNSWCWILEPCCSEWPAYSETLKVLSKYCPI